MAVDIGIVLTGTIGQFWAQRDGKAISLDSEPVSGVAQLRDDGVFELNGLASDSPRRFLLSNDANEDAVDYFLAATEHGSLLLDGVSQAGGSISIGGLKVSTARHSIEHVVSGLSFQHLNGRQFTSASTHWSGIAEWAGLRAVTYDERRDEEGRVTALTLHVEAPEPESVSLNEELTLLLGSSWSVGGSSDSRFVRTPTELTVVSTTGAPLADLLIPQLKIQDLFCLAHEGHLGATGGIARISEAREYGLGGELWSRIIMTDRAGVRKADVKLLPLFELSDIGGVSGLRAWLELYDAHPRLLRPILGRFHTGRQFAEQLIVEVGAAIEYWWGANRRDPTRSWSAESLQPLAVARSLGNSFELWTGDAKRWAELFRHNYNGLKHYIPDYILKPSEVNALALSGLSLLTCVALQEVVGAESAICARLLRNHRWEERGAIVRELVTSS